MVNGCRLDGDAQIGVDREYVVIRQIEADKPAPIAPQFIQPMSRDTAIAILFHDQARLWTGRAGVIVDRGGKSARGGRSVDTAAYGAGILHHLVCAIRGRGVADGGLAQNHAAISRPKYGRVDPIAREIARQRPGSIPE